MNVAGVGLHRVENDVVDQGLDLDFFERDGFQVVLRVAHRAAPARG